MFVYVREIYSAECQRLAFLTHISHISGRFFSVRKYSSIKACVVNKIPMIGVLVCIFKVM